MGAGKHDSCVKLSKSSSKGSLLMFVVVAVHMCVFQGVGFQDTIPEGTLARSPENMPRAKVKHFSGSQCSTHKTYTATDVEACTSGHIHIHVT